ncbi:hypothetical protein VC83_05269 [Pseudogymnoascus destructans]|uniref:Uncharacterized protein n=2 Tax=Pseudogymnoascus destructans TaxID=655981 RepID=L8G405_PSED2|nr:uncharacterized protein VC83_05269 [Pseudogymnoascus destructans]ELR06671.1 hypothetical protein GMDG_00288 [Pseudogymnoascus destructans 20631-21]OAF57920.1 hypothetical protein VC83_05269 [Pseudogymnoascus destructans]
MSRNSALKRLYSSSSSSASANDSPATTTATTPDPSQSRRESEHDDNDSASSTAFNPAKVSSKLTTLAASAATVVPGSDEGHPNDPLLRVYDPSKDDNLSMEELLARPRLPRTPHERAAMNKLKAGLETVANGGASAELGPKEQLAAKKLLEQAGEALKKADREEHMKLIMGMAKDVDASYARSNEQ